jgi:hypothetical protein
MPGPTATTPQLWIKADAGVYVDAGVTLATNGQTVEQWNDQSGNGNNATQATSGNRPTYNTNKYNGLPAITFAATNLITSGSLGPLAQPYTIFVVVRQSTFKANRTAVDTSNGTNECAVLANNSDILDIYAGSNVTGGGTGPWPTTYCAVFNGASSSLNRNGTLIISGNAGTKAMNDLRLGANPSAASPWVGDIMEALVYAGTLSAGETAQINAYLLRWLPSVTYRFYTFNGGSNVLRVLTSSDALSWTDLVVSYTPTDGIVRDPSAIVLSGATWLAHTNANMTQTSTFSIASAPDGLTFTPVVDVDCSAITGSGSGARAWAPEWFADVTAPQGVRVFVALSSTGDPGNFQIYETHPTNVAFTTWSVPVVLAGTSLPVAMIDPFMVYRGGTYYLWFKDETTKYVCVTSSSSLLTGYTVLHSGDWIPIGANHEGPALLTIGGVDYLWTDAYAASGEQLTAQSAGDWTSGSGTWTSSNYVTAPAPAVHHGTVIIAPPVASFTGTPLSGTAPLAVTFTDTSSNTPTSWSWTFGDGGTSTAQNPTHTYSAPGTYTVALTATNAGGSNTVTKTGYVVVSSFGIGQPFIGIGIGIGI